MHLASTAVVLALAQLTWGCATAPPVPPPAPVAVAVPFANTTDTCVERAPVRLTVADAITEVTPGETARLMIAEGVHQARIEALWTDRAPEITRSTWRIGGEALPRYIGCTAPEFLAQHRGARAVDIVHHAHGCVPGVIGAARLSLGGRALALLPRGTEARRFLPAGTHQVQVDDASGTRSLAVDVRAGPARIELGCPVEAFAAAGRLPLTLVTPAGPCASAEWRVRAAGMERVLARDAALTVFAPPGVHLVTWTHPGRAPMQQRVELWTMGQVLEAAACGAAAGASEG